MNIYLIGYRCTGKTTLGQVLAKRLGRVFVDMDDALVAAHKQTIADMVRRHGWGHFRYRERQLLETLARRTGQVVATGGGVILNPDNAATLRATGTVVWLRCRSTTIEGRMASDPRSGAMRPRLTEHELQREIEATLAAREPLYRDAMHLAVDTDDADTHRQCDAIITALKHRDGAEV